MGLINIYEFSHLQACFITKLVVLILKMEKDDSICTPLYCFFVLLCAPHLNLYKKYSVSWPRERVGTLYFN